MAIQFCRKAKHNAAGVVTHFFLNKLGNLNGFLQDYQNAYRRLLKPVVLIRLPRFELRGLPCRNFVSARNDTQNYFQAA
ncbi:MAG: hypothetical protein IKG79_07075 [Neisseriaceae bacterium]|nr:hypothetical protein [Neisseriaceae bacterium]